MMYIIFAILFAVIFVVFAIWQIFISNEAKNAKFLWAAGAFAAVLIIEGLMFWGNSAVECEANNMILISNFGVIEERVLEPGLHWVSPWKKTREIQGRGVFETSDQLTVPICDTLLGSVSVEYKINSTYTLDKTKVYGIGRILGLDFQTQLDSAIFSAAQKLVHQEIMTTKTPFNVDILQKRLQSELDSRVNLQLEHIGIKGELAKGAVKFTPPIVGFRVTRTVQTQEE